MIKKRILFFSLFVMVFTLVPTYLYLKRVRAIRFFVQKPIEYFLTDLFGMRVKIEGLSFDPVSGDFSCRRFRIMNQEIFSNRPHIEMANLSGRVETQALLDRKVLIEELRVGTFNYLMERTEYRGDTRTNARVMAWHIKDWKKQHPPHAQLPSDKKEKPGWQIKIDHFIIQNGSFIYESNIPTHPVKLVFEPLHGELTGFDFPTADPNKLEQTVVLEGMVGSHEKVPFRIGGMANFATNNVGFKLNGTVEKGPVEEYKIFWRGIPVKLEDGKFKLFIEARYHEDFLDSMYHLTLIDLKVSGGNSVVQKIWGLPRVAFFEFLKNEKSLLLQIPVNGDITDPKFELTQAFHKAFKKAFQQKATGSIGIVKDGTSKIAEGTQALASKASETIRSGVGKVTEIVAAQASALNQGMTPPPANPSTQQQPQEKA